MVIIWLGEKGDYTAQDFTTIAFAALDIKERLDRNGQPFEFRFNSFGARVRTALSHILACPYWGRIWITQELASQGCSATLLQCGPHFLPLNDLHIVIDQLKRHKREEAESAREFDIPEFLIRRLPLFKILDSERQEEDEDFKEEYDDEEDKGREKRRKRERDKFLLGLMIYAKASDPRDLVYGLLGLFSCRLRALITPDYRLPLMQVYGDFVKAFVLGHGYFFVTYMHVLSEPAPWPTWIPDFRNIASGLSMPIDENMFHASGDTTVALRVSEDGNSLFCRAFIVDTVDGHGRPSVLNGKVGHPRRQILYRSRPELHDIIYHTLVDSIFGKDEKGRPQRILEKIRLENDDANWETGFVDRNGALLLNGTTLSDWLFQARSIPFSTEPAPSVCESETSVEIERRLFGHNLITTESGHIGLAPMNAQRGDKLAIVLGCGAPLLLRPHLTAYKILGPCYVHGYMEGETVRDSSYLEKLEMLEIV